MLFIPEQSEWRYSMNYKAIRSFTDVTSDGKHYKKGDEFTGTKERLKELSTKDNKAGVPVIKGTPKPDDKKEDAKKKEDTKKKDTKKKKEAKGSK